MVPMLPSMGASSAEEVLFSVSSSIVVNTFPIIFVELSLVFSLTAGEFGLTTLTADLEFVE